MAENKNQSVLISGVSLSAMRVSCTFTYISYLIYAPSTASLYQASRGRGRRKAPSASCSSSRPRVGALPAEQVGGWFGSLTDAAAAIRTNQYGWMAMMMMMMVHDDGA